MKTQLNIDNIEVDDIKLFPVVANVLITDSSYTNVISANGYVSNTGGYVVINGGVFGSGTRVLLDTNTPVSAISTQSPDQLRIEIQSGLASRSYALTIVNISTGNTSIFPAALTVSGIDAWGNAYILTPTAVDGNVFENLGNLDANITYTISTGSRVPSNVVLEANGLLTGSPNIAATYAFTVLATDENSSTAERDFILKVL